MPPLNCWVNAMCRRVACRTNPISGGFGIGKVLNELNRLELAEKTIVVLWSDHGFHLGELDSWGKHTAFEHALRSPLMIRVPGMNAPGVMAQALTETVDIYPTLAEL